MKPVELPRFYPAFMNKGWLIYDSKIDRFYRKNGHVWVYIPKRKAQFQANKLNEKYKECT